MIKSFKNKETEKVYNRLRSKKLPSDIQKTALRKLWMLDAATNLNDLRIPPNNHLEALRGTRSGQYSICINKQWRICFIWKAGNVHEVEIIDYH